MLSVEEALARVLEVDLPRRVEAVPLWEAHGRFLAQELRATMPLPRWDNSAMDGYAVRAADTAAAAPGGGGDPCGPDGEPLAAPTGAGAAILEVVETIAAGQVGERRLGPGQCARIMTGAPVPEGADAVVMREHAELLDGGRVRIERAARPGQHIRRAGEETREGDLHLAPGHHLDAPSVGLCGAFGLATVAVVAPPRVAILATGDEVVPPGQPLGPGQIYSSNSVALAGLVREAGGLPLDAGIATDDLAGTRAAFRRALELEPDLLLSTGGVSVGDFDVVKEALAEEGADMRFWKVRVKPGKPLAFGVIGGRPAFGLPGNPVSCLVNFLQFVRPVIRRALGDPRPFLPVLQAQLTEGARKKPGRNELLRVSLRWEGATLLASPTGSQSSGQVTSLVRGHGFALLSAECTEVPAGGSVAVQVFDPTFAAQAEPGYRWAPLQQG